jgi:hypothetical protein
LLGLTELSEGIEESDGRDDAEGIEAEGAEGSDGSEGADGRVGMENCACAWVAARNKMAAKRMAGFMRFSGFFAV